VRLVHLHDMTRDPPTTTHCLVTMDRGLSPRKAVRSDLIASQG